MWVKAYILSTAAYCRHTVHYLFPAPFHCWHCCYTLCNTKSVFITNILTSTCHWHCPKNSQKKFSRINIFPISSKQWYWLLKKKKKKKNKTNTNLWHAMSPYKCFMYINRKSLILNHSPMNEMPFVPFHRWRNEGLDRVKSFLQGSESKRQDQNCNEELSGHGTGGRPDLLLWAAIPANALCPSLTPFIIIILNNIPVTHVEYSSTSSPICYWISMVFHMKTINNRKDLDPVSKT